MKISIITLTTDKSIFLEQALDSVVFNNSYDIEQIIVHDGSSAFIERVKRKYPQIRILYGRGCGATAAAIQGLNEASGDFIIFLHSDDRLGINALMSLNNCAKRYPNVRIWTGYARIFKIDSRGNDVTIRYLSQDDNIQLRLANICDDIPLLTARFCHKSLFSKNAGLRADFPESSDREFLLRALINQVEEGPLRVLVSELRQHNGSKTINNLKKFQPKYLSEHIKIADMWLRNSSIDKNTKLYLIKWKSRELLRLSLYKFYNGDAIMAMRLFIKVIANNPSGIFFLWDSMNARNLRRRNESKS